MERKRERKDILRIIGENLIGKPSRKLIRLQYQQKLLVAPIITPLIRTMYFPMREEICDWKSIARTQVAASVPRWKRPSISQSEVLPLDKRMIRRSRSLDVHGLTKNTYDGLHPLPEKPQETLTAEQARLFRQPLPLPDDDDDEDSGDDKLMLSTASSIQSDCSTSTFYCDESLSSVRTMDNTSTDRSSVYSWGNDDEFDRKAGMQVRAMFDEVDACLFEDANVENNLRQECLDWRSSFPYLRILGHQVLAESESGTQMISVASDSSSASNVNNDFQVGIETADNNEHPLTVSGEKMEVVQQPVASNDSYLEEEIFAIDGNVEEFIAFDNNSSDTREENARSRRTAMPPITPHNFAHDSALSECFDRVWSQIVKTLTGLLKLYIQLRAKKELESKQQHPIYNAPGDRYLESSLELSSTADMYRPQHAQVKNKSSADVGGLNDIMTIRSVSLKQRAPSVNANGTKDEHMQNVHNRPESSNTVVTHRQFPKSTNFRAAEQQFYDRMMSAKGQKRSIRLQPLTTPKTINQAEANVGEVRGKGLSMSSDRSFTPSYILNNQQTWSHRNGSLPPLDRVGTADVPLSYKEHRTKSPKRNTRASSATSNQIKYLSQRDRTNYSTISDSRPSTLQSSRTDLPPTKASSTHHSRLRDAIHGVSLKHIFPSHGTSSSSNDTVNYNHPSSNTKTDDTQQEFDDFVLWGHGHPLISSQQRRAGKTLSSSNLR